MKVVIDLRGGKLVLEGDGPDLIKVLEVARSIAPHVSQIQITTGCERESNTPPESRDLHDQTVTQPHQTQTTLRQFARSLTLENTSERIAAIAYYVNKIEKRPSFSPKDLDGWFTMCGFQKPGQMAVALFDSKRKYGYMENSGRGMWRISNQGENLMIAKIEDSGTT